MGGFPLIQVKINWGNPPIINLFQLLITATKVIKAKLYVKQA